LPWSILCGIGVRFNFICHEMFGGVSDEPALRTGRRLLPFNRRKRLLASIMPAAAERHDGIASALHIATDMMHRPQHVFDSVGAGERTAQRTLIAVPETAAFSSGAHDSNFGSGRLAGRRSRGLSRTHCRSHPASCRPSAAISSDKRSIRSSSRWQSSANPWMICTMRGDGTWSAWQRCEVTRRARIEDLAEQRRRAPRGRHEFD